MILKNKIIFILGITKFDGDIESTSFTTAKFLAKENDVYYIDSPYTLKDYFLDKDKLQRASRKDAFLSSDNCLLTTDISRLKVLVLPPLLSTNFLPEGRFYRTLLAFNEQLIFNRIKSIIEKQKIEDFIFINSFNFHYPNVGTKLKPSLLVYHCVDPLVIAFDRRHGLTSEKIILQQSDLVVCTSKRLHKEKMASNENTHFIPNAADLDHCSSALNENLQIYHGLTTINKPIIGYFGNIERRMNFDLLQRVAINHPQKSFVFVGPADDSYVPYGFRDLPNVFFLGKVPYKDMPSVLKGFDVSIIPFKKDEVSDTIFPLKLFEYIGAGKPVVATDFNLDLKDYTGDTVIYCKDEVEFSGAIDYSLTLDLITHRKKCLFVARINTWDNRLSEFSELLSSNMKKKSSA